MRPQAGGGLQALSNFYTCLFGPQGDVESMSASDWRALVTRMRELPGSAVVQLQPLDASSEWLAAFEKALHTKRYWTDRFFCFGNWYQPVASGGFAAYWSERPSALRHSVERGRRRLEKAGPWRIDIVTSESDELEAAVAAYASVYGQSWKQPEPCPAFMPGLIRTAAREGWLRLGVLWLDGRPLAAQVWLVHGGKANIYKLAYVEGFQKLSAGSVLTAALMQHVIDVDRVVEVDYLSGDDAYKADWMAMRRERVGLLACDLLHWQGWLAAGRHVLGRWARRTRAALTG
ncbi:GNAT family N-acetyltransferase [Hydrogenophaga sp. PBL-H3]|nr:GNAT family N-acetyltransferase [Hydrogenophaga sp. PBL-H3]QHE82825.1 GNAT family N-acetyltransferase [Hydrogenophaga sp. PBL-H3]